MLRVDITDEEKLLLAVERVQKAQEYEEQKRFGIALDTYTLAITELLSNYRKFGDQESQRSIRECVDSILARSDYIRKHIDWQEDLDHHKEEFLQQERLYTELYQSSDEMNKHLSLPPQYEPPPSYNEAIESILKNSIHSKKVKEKEKLIDTHKDVYNTFHSFDVSSHQSIEVCVRPILNPTEFIRESIKPLPPVSYTISRTFSNMPDIIKQKSRRTSLLLESKQDSFLKRKSLRLGKTFEEMTDITKYMISTGIRTSVVKMMGNDVWDPWQMHQQLGSQVFHFSDQLTTPPNRESDSSVSLLYKAKYKFTFCDYAQFLFRELRWQNKIDCDHYVHSLAADPDGNSIENMMSEGKSSANFFQSQNGEFVVKTLNEAEFEFFLQILVNYTKFQVSNPNTFITRLYGLHKIQPENEEPLHFVVMENLIPIYSGITRFDLKGSKVGRAATEEEKQEGGVLKDLDFVVPFIMSTSFQNTFFNQLAIDCNWLEQQMIMDYSFLVGIESRPVTACSSEISITQSPSIFKAETGGFRSTDENNIPLNTIYYVGLIDILQPYNMRKKVEHALKSITESPTDISCVEPSTYSKRLQTFLRANTASAISMDCLLP